MTTAPIIEQRSIPVVSTDSVIEIEHLYKTFGDNTVLADFSLVLRKGENVAVLGKSGSGKSVLIKCIIGLMRADKGSIRLLGQDIDNLDHQELDEIRSRVGFLFQSNALYDSMTVRENLEFPLRRHWIKMTSAEQDAKVLEVLSNVGLAHAVDMMPAELSGGMRKRIALARTLILDPEIIFYDEPTTGLDPITGKGISKLIREMGEKYNTSALIISHDMNCIRMTADRIIMLIDGTCYAQGSYEELKLNNDPKVKQFFE
ncbi:MAG: ATP-binding cassette domain-containing protein [Chitinophagaceae bacterium]|jgi:phospholipid/cholesterol/gamma-HCH transport system ATP-binding protein|nr:ATP-binding cassette domain-containing protein [Chitinophagaceae bacterium]